MNETIVRVNIGHAEWLTVPPHPSIHLVVFQSSSARQFIIRWLHPLSHYYLALDSSE